MEQDRNKKYYRTYQVLIVIYSMSAVVIAIQKGLAADYYPVTQCMVALALLLVPKVFWRVTKLKVAYDVNVLYVLFCFLTVIGGSALRGYTYVPGWDKLLHFASGFLLAIVGLSLYDSCTKGVVNIHTWLKTCFIICFAVTGATVWEFYEYGLYVFAGIDALNVGTTGIHDTLLDMLVCTLGSMIMAFGIRRAENKGKTSYLLNVYRHFRQLNP